MSAYIKASGLHVYLATTKKSYVGNDKHIEANAQALITLRQSLSKDYLSIISHCDSDFTVWNTLTSLKEQASNNIERESIVNEFEQTGYIVQGNDSLEVMSDTHLDDHDCSSIDDNYIDAHALYEELSMFCETC